MQTYNQRRDHRPSPTQIVENDRASFEAIDQYFEYLHTLELRVRHFEDRFDMSTDTMLRLIQEGQIRETREHVQWFMAYEALKRETEWQKRRSSRVE